MLSLFNPRGNRNIGGAPSLKVVGVRERRDEVSKNALSGSGPLKEREDGRVFIPARTAVSDACKVYLATAIGTPEALEAVGVLLAAVRKAEAGE